MNKDYKICKKAFTLAEVLLTLTIVGVLIGLMFGVVNIVKPDKEKLLFLKSYRSIEKIVGQSINDPYRYDQENYSELERALLSEKERHMDFRDNPYPDFVLTINGQDIRKINQKEAVCLYLANGFNVLGTINCNNNAGLNFKSTDGICFYNWYGVNKEGTITGEISPLCNDNRYPVTVFKNGNVTVPESSAAYVWMQNQTEFK